MYEAAIWNKGLLAVRQSPLIGKWHTRLCTPKLWTKLENSSIFAVVEDIFRPINITTHPAWCRIVTWSLYRVPYCRLACWLWLNTEIFVWECEKENYRTYEQVFFLNTTLKCLLWLDFKSTVTRIWCTD